VLKVPLNSNQSVNQSIRYAGSAHSVHRAFSVAGPSLWNSTRQLERSGSCQGQLQTSVKSETHLFSLH